MIDIIGLYEGLLPETDLDAMVTAEKLFDHLGYYKHSLALQELVGVKAFENDDKAQNSYNVYYHHTLFIISQFGIVITADGVADVNLQKLVVVLEGLVALEDPDNVDVIDEVLNEELDSPNLILSTVLAQVTDLTMTDFMEFIEDADPAVIDKLRQMSSDLFLDLEIVETTKEIRNRFKNLMQDAKKGPTYEFAVQLQELPVSREAVYSYIIPRIVEENDKSMYEVALAIVGAEVLANTRPDMIRDRALQAREELLPPGFDLADIDIDDIVTEFIENE
jgi:hypothetical protein